MTVPVPAGNHPVSAIVTAPGRAIVAAQVSLASGRANMGNVTGTLPVANGGTGATNASDARANLGIFPMTTEQVDEVMDDDTAIVSDNTVNGTVFSYIWGKIKAWAAAAFAPLSHTHTQGQISDTPITVANGGTGASTAAGAKANLVDGQALTPASVTATGAISGSSVSDSVGSLASLRESVSLFERSYTVNGVTFEFRKFGRVVVVISRGTPTNAVTTTEYAGNTTLDAAFKPAGTFIAHVTALAGVTMQIIIGQADGNFTYGIASSTIGTSSNIRCCFSYMAAS